MCVFTAQAMHNHLRRYGRFIVGFDATGDILGASSDVLHALYFLNNGTAFRVAICPAKMNFLLRPCSTMSNTTNCLLCSVHFIGDVSDVHLVEEQQAAAVLETRLGYLTSLPSVGAATDAVDPYHVNTVWPFEQALINIAAHRHDMSRALEVRS